jgi:hypothetical protein
MRCAPTIFSLMTLLISAFHSVKAADNQKPAHPTSSNGYPQAVLASEPAGYWRFEETKGLTAVDSSKHGRDGRFHGTVELGQSGAFPIGGDKSIRLDGKSSYVEVPSSSAFSVPTSGKGLTMEVWVKPSALEFKGETKDPYVYWIGKGEPGQFEWALRFYSRKSTRPNRISAYVFNAKGGLGAGAYVEEPVQADEWVHIAACFDPGSTHNPKAGVSIYKNGVFRGGPANQRGALYSSYDIVPVGGSAPVRLGTRNFTSFFAGSLDEFAIYPRVLSAAEIMAHYRSALANRAP